MYKVELRGVTGAGQVYRTTYNLTPKEMGEFIARLAGDFKSQSIFEMNVEYVG